MDNVVLGVGLLLGGGGFATIVVKVLERRQTAAQTTKTTAEAEMTDAQRTDIITQASQRAVSMMSEQLAAAYARITVLESAVSTQTDRIKVLEEQLRSLGVNPDEIPHTSV